jgi:glycerol-3-phosphate responsive antiterminator
MGNIEKPSAELPDFLRFVPRPIGDWIDMPFVLQEVEQELRSEVLAVGLETMANAHRAIADGAAKVASILRGGAAKR